MSEPKLSPVRPAGRAISRKSRRRPFYRAVFYKESVCAWIFISPALLGFTVFYLIPCVRAIYVSLTDWNLLRPDEYGTMRRTACRWPTCVRHKKDAGRVRPFPPSSDCRWARAAWEIPPVDPSDKESARRPPQLARSPVAYARTSPVCVTS